MTDPYSKASAPAGSSGTMLPEFFVPKKRRSLRIYITLGAVAAVLTVSCIFVFLLSRCLTFYAFMLPQDEYSVVYGVNHPSTTKHASEAVVGVLLAPEAASQAETFNQYLYAKSDTKEIIIGVRKQPGNIFSRTYNTLRAGIIDIEYVAGMREQVPVSKPFTAAFNTLRWSFQNRAYMSPTIVAYAQVGELLGNSQPVSAVVKERKNAVTFAYERTPQFHLPASRKDERTLPASDYQYIAIPSHVLELLPDEISTDIEAKFIPLSGLTSSNVSLASALETAESFAIYSKGEEGAIALGGPQAPQLVLAWIASEYGKNHPVTESFILPDGTRGFEVVPEQVVSEIFSDTAKPGCRSAKVNGESLITCQVGDWSVISKHESAAFALSDLVGSISTEAAALHMKLPSSSEDSLLPPTLGGSILTYTGTVSGGVGEILRPE